MTARAPSRFAANAEDVSRPIGLIAGQGALPVIVAEGMRARGLYVAARRVAVKGRSR